MAKNVLAPAPFASVAAQVATTPLIASNRRSCLAVHFLELGAGNR
jgi:hypothetical protein